MSASEAEARPSALRGRRTAFVVGAVVVLIDQLTKWWALVGLDDGNTIDLVWTLRLRLIYNPGFAFGLGEGFGPVLAIVATLVAVGLIIWAGRQRSLVVITAAGLLAGGAIGNVVDRVFRDGEGFLGGFVIDFVDLQWWPVFNVADMAITSGVIGFVVFGGRVVDGRSE